MKKLRITAKIGKNEGVLTFPVPIEMEAHLAALRDKLFDALTNDTAASAEETFVVSATTAI